MKSLVGLTPLELRILRSCNEIEGPCGEGCYIHHMNSRPLTDRYARLRQIQGPNEEENLRGTNCCGVAEIVSVSCNCECFLRRTVIWGALDGRGLILATLSSRENREIDEEKLKSVGFSPLGEAFANPNSGNVVQVWGLYIGAKEDFVFGENSHARAMDDEEDYEEDDYVPYDE